MHDTLTRTIKAVMEEIVISFFTLDFPVTPVTTVEIGDEDSYEAPTADITAVIAFNGDIEGGLHLAAPSHVALQLAGALTGEAFSEVDDVVADAFGELANVIAGSVKDKLSENDRFQIKLTPPMVAMGEDNTFRYSSLMNSTRQYFVIKNAPFFVEVFY